MGYPKPEPIWNSTWAVKFLLLGLGTVGLYQAFSSIHFSPSHPSHAAAKNIKH